MKKIHLFALGMLMLSSGIKLNACDLKDEWPITSTQHSMGRDDEPLPFTLTAGFSKGETTHRWAEDNKAILTIPIQQNLGRVKGVMFEDMWALGAQSVNVLINNDSETRKTTQFNGNASKKTISVRFPSGLTGDAEITFEMPNAQSPQNGDARLLGVCFDKVKLIYSTQFHVGDAGRTFPFTLNSGFSTPQGDHRWSEGKQAKIIVPFNQPYGKKIKALRFVNTKALDDQKLTVYVNNQAMSSYKYDASTPQHTLIVPLTYLNNDRAEILFDTPDSHTPRNGDIRELGIMFDAVDVLYEGSSFHPSKIRHGHVHVHGQGGKHHHGQYGNKGQRFHRHGCNAHK